MYAPPRLLAHSDVRDPEVLVLDCSGPASMTEAELFCKKKNRKACHLACEYLQIKLLSFYSLKIENCESINNSFFINLFFMSYNILQGLINSLLLFFKVFGTLRHHAFI